MSGLGEPFVLLIHAHDHVWRSDAELRDRITACEIIWRAAGLLGRRQSPEDGE